MFSRFQSLYFYIILHQLQDNVIAETLNQENIVSLWLHLILSSLLSCNSRPVPWFVTDFFWILTIFEFYTIGLPLYPGLYDRKHIYISKFQWVIMKEFIWSFYNQTSYLFIWPSNRSLENGQISIDQLMINFNWIRMTQKRRLCL